MSEFSSPIYKLLLNTGYGEAAGGWRKFAAIRAEDEYQSQPWK